MTMIYLYVCIFELADHRVLYLYVIDSLDIPGSSSYTTYQKYIIKNDISCKSDGKPWDAI